MYEKEKELKIRSLLRLFICALADILIYGIFLLLISKAQIRNAALLNLCGSAMDMAKIILVSLLLSFVLIITTNIKDIESRWKKGLLELLAIVGFLCFCIFGWNHGLLLADIFLFGIVFLLMLVRDTAYLNRFVVVASGSRLHEAASNYQTWYQEILALVDRFNAKEELLAGLRKQYAESNRDRVKAEKDKISVDVKVKWDPQFFTVPWDPKMDEYMGFNGFFHGREVVERYYREVKNYISDLDARYKKGELKRREIESWECDTENQIQFMMADGAMEERMGGTVQESRVKRAKVLKRSPFEKKRRHF